MRVLSQSIQREAIRQQEMLDWPNFVPGFAELKRGDGKTVFCRYDDLDVGKCEQAVELYARRARAAVKRGAVVAAGKNIVLARVFRCRYLSLIGKTDSTEDDMPFPHFQYEE